MEKVVPSAVAELPDANPSSVPSAASTIGDVRTTINACMQKSYSNAVGLSDSEKEALLDGLVRLENESWPEGTRAPREAFENRVNIFPEGVFFCQQGDDFGGLSTSLVFETEDPNAIKSWEEITDWGMITNHNPAGNALYVVSVGASPRFRGQGIGGELVKYQVGLAEKLGLKYVILGSRVPDYHKYDGDIESYLAERDENGRSIDSLISFYQGCGLEIGKIKSNYMEDDKESRNYGVIMYKKF